MASGRNLGNNPAMPAADVVAALVALGFNLNEGRAYATLLRLGAATGYEVGQQSGVPRSAVYAVLRRLVDAGAARAVSGSPERFIATSSEVLITMLQKRFNASTDSLSAGIERMKVSPPVPDAFSVKGHERVMEEAARLVSSAKQTLVIGGWPRELSALQTELSEAAGRSVYTVIFSHAALSEQIAGIHFSYALDEQALESFWEHRLVIVADEKRSLIGATQQTPQDTAVLSEAPAIAEFATSQVVLDITLLAQRHDHDVSAVMAKMIGDRVGRLDVLLAAGIAPVLGKKHGRPRRRRAKR